MSKVKLLTIFSLTLIMFASCGGVRRDDRVIARREINTTAGVISRAERAVRIGRNYTGDLAFSVRHQRYAVYLFYNGRFVRAENQTLYARRLAYRAIIANNGMLSAQEYAFANNNNGPSEAELNADLQNNGQPYNLKDEDIVMQDTGKPPVSANTANTQDANKAQEDMDIQVR